MTTTGRPAAGASLTPDDTPPPAADAGNPAAPPAADTANPAAPPEADARNPAAPPAADLPAAPAPLPPAADAANPAAPPAADLPAAPAPLPPATSQPSVARSSSVMAIGTTASRATGFIRTAVLLYAIGTKNLGDAYNVANTVPNAVYSLALGGILTSVVVPLLVKAARTDADGGEAYDQRMFTLGVLGLGAMTLIATAATLPITAIYGHGLGNAATYHLTLIFTYFFMPQIFFYGVSSLAGAILNARGSFASPMWTPIVNNVVVSLVGVALIVLAGTGRTPQTISAGEVQLLGIGTTLGIVLQTAAMWPSLRKVGFRWHPRLDLRRAEIAEIGRMGGWMFFYIVVTQLSFLATTIVSNVAGARVCSSCAGAGFAAFSNAWQLFQLPYAIVGMSVITAMLPRMSEHAAAGSGRLLTRDFSAATRLSSVIVVPSALILAVLGPPLAAGLFGHGSTSTASARYLGIVFGIFCLGLLPFTLFNLLLRAFYATHDSRTPALLGGVGMAVRIAFSFLALAILPPADVVAGLGVAFGIGSVVMTVLLWRVFGQRVGGLDTRRITRTLVRMHIACVPGVAFAVAAWVVIGRIAPAGTITSLAIVVVGGIGGLLLYLITARLLRIDEVSVLTRSVRTRLRIG